MAATHFSDVRGSSAVLEVQMFSLTGVGCFGKMNSKSGQMVRDRGPGRGCVLTIESEYISPHTRA